jgi:hypothetical protein
VRYTVVWTLRAEKELAQVWLEASDKSQLSAVANELERLLRENDAARRASGVGNIGVLGIAPLSVAYAISDADHLITIFTAWRMKGP